MNSVNSGEKTAAAQLSLFACALLWSTGGILIKSAEWSPTGIAGFRSLVGAVVILAYLRKPVFSFSFAQVSAALAYSATMVLFVWATKTTTAANAILLQYAAPVWVALLSGPMLKEKAARSDLLTLGIVVTGLVLFFIDKTGTGSVTGNLLALLSGVTFAFFAIFMRKQKGSSSLESLLLAHIITVSIALPFMITSPPRTTDLPQLLALGIFQVGAASILFSRGIKRVTALQSLLITTAEPILNPVWVFIFMNERPSLNAVLAGAVIIAAVTLNSVMALKNRGSAEA